MEQQTTDKHRIFFPIWEMGKVAGFIQLWRSGEGESWRMAAEWNREGRCTAVGLNPDFEAVDIKSWVSRIPELEANAELAREYREMIAEIAYRRAQQGKIVLGKITGSPVEFLKWQGDSCYYYSFEKGKDPNREACCWLLVCDPDNFTIFNPAREIFKPVKEYADYADMLIQKAPVTTFHQQQDIQYSRLITGNYNPYKDHGCIIQFVEQFNPPYLFNPELSEYCRRHLIEHGYPLDYDMFPLIEQAWRKKEEHERPTNFSIDYNRKPVKRMDRYVVDKEGI